MYFALVFPCLPHPSSNGWGMISWAISKSLLEANHEIKVFSLLRLKEVGDAANNQAALLELGVEPVIVPVSGYGLPKREWSRRHFIKLLFNPGIATFFPNITLVPQMKLLLEQAAPDAVLAFHYDAIAATHGLNVAPRIALTADIWHWPNMYWWRTMKPQFSNLYVLRTLESLENLMDVPRYMVKLVNDCEACLSFGEYDANWLKRHGAKNINLIHPPIDNISGIDPGIRRSSNLHHYVKPKILVGLSDLFAIATREAVRFFAEEILMRLEKDLGAEGFEVHVIGKGDPPEELKKILPRPSVIMRGWVEPNVDDELLSADVVLIPTPIVFALRNRIIYAFSLGCCVVAHTNEAKNLPEMSHEENALLASDGQSLAAAVVRAIRDPELRIRLGTNARRTYEKYFTRKVATAPIISELERSAREWKV